MNRRGRTTAALGFAVALALGGCDWVDSTGAQPGDAADGADGVDGTDGTDGADLGTDLVPGPVDGATSVVDLGDVAPGAAVALLEGTRPRVVVPAADGVADDGTALGLAWEEMPLAEGALEACAGLDGFDPARAPATLAEACTDPDACRLSFAPVDPGGAGAAAFELAVPLLRAPVGTRRALVGVASVAPDPAVGGEPAPQERFRREIDFCLIAINEAPDARDDEYALAADGTLEVDASAGVLANDVDDVDTSNAGLSVSPVPLRAPERAAFFELRPDGGFTYVALPAGAADGNDDGDENGGDDGGDDGAVVDGFEYEASDGVQVASATVTLRAGSANLAPVPVEGAAPVVASAGTFVFVDLSDRFADPEGAPLSFSIVEPLPDDGSLALSPGGTLAGVPGPGDVGEYSLTLVADDGEAAAAAPLVLVVEPDPTLADDAPPPLGPPPGPEFVPGTVFDQSVPLGRAVVPVRPAFDGGAPPLEFAAGGEPLPRGVVVDPASGAVAGRPRRAGTFEGLVVTATDANGAEASSAPFSIEVFRE